MVVEAPAGLPGRPNLKAKIDPHRRGPGVFRRRRLALAAHMLGDHGPKPGGPAYDWPVATEEMAARTFGLTLAALDDAIAAGTLDPIELPAGRRGFRIEQLSLISGVPFQIGGDGSPHHLIRAKGGRARVS